MWYLLTNPESRVKSKHAETSWQKGKGESKWEP